MTTIPDAVRAEADRLIGLASRMALILSQRAAHRLALKRMIELASLVAGLAALLISVYPGAQELLGLRITSSIVLASGVMLIASVVVDRLFKDPPERYADFSFYIGSYEATIRELLLDHEDPNSARRLREVVRVAEMNINDVRKNWPDIFAKSTGDSL